MYTTIDDFVMSNLRQVGDKALTSAENSSLDLPTTAASEDKKDTDESKSGEKSEDDAKKAESLSDVDAKHLCAWLKVALGSRVRDVKITNRLSDSPAIVTDHESGTMRRMLRMVVRMLFA